MRYGTFASLVAILALLTGLCLGQLVTLERPAASDRTVSIADARVGDAFYRSVNTYLSTGDAAELDPVVDPSVRTNLPGISGKLGRDGLMAYLDRIRAVDPVFQLLPGTMQSSLRGITAEISFQSSPAVFVAGLPVPAASFWGYSDYLELRDGRVVALWTSMPAMVHPFLESSRGVTTPAPGLIEPTLERWSLEPHIVYRPETGKTPTIVRVLSGAALIAIEKEGDGPANTRWTSDSAQPEPLRAGEPVRLGPDDVVSIAPLARFTIVAQGVDPAELAVLTQERLASTDTLARDSHRGSDGVPRLIVARGAPRIVSGESLSLDTLALELPVGAEGLDHQASRYEIVYVAAGKLHLTVESGKAWQANPDRTSVRIGETMIVEAGSGFIVDRGSQVTFEPLDGAASFWLTTVAPASGVSASAM